MIKERESRGCAHRSAYISRNRILSEIFLSFTPFKNVPVEVRIKSVGRRRCPSPRRSAIDMNRIHGMQRSRGVRACVRIRVRARVRVAGIEGERSESSEVGKLSEYGTD